jgi:cytochrome P450
MAAFPKETALAQEEISKKIGFSRAPTWKDLDTLPYTSAFVKEVQRFRPVANLGLPHEMVKDELIDGYLYPKGAIVFINMCTQLLYFSTEAKRANLRQGHIFHDERYFEEPYTFNPERFMNNPYGIKDGIEDDPARRDNIVFGGGRRVCPGLRFANSSMVRVLSRYFSSTNAQQQILSLTLLWGFNFSPALDDNGREIKPDIDNVAKVRQNY